MKINERELAKISGGKSEFEGRLNYKRINTTNQYYQSVFKERWFKLMDNFLFYFRIDEFGKISDKQPIGFLVLENAAIQTENVSDSPFAFSITFMDEPDRKHVFSCMSEASAATWAFKLRSASYEYLRSQLYMLQSRIYSKTGKDPLLMVPRNLGSMKWAPGQPMPGGGPASASNGFATHSHDEGGIHRSRSSVNVHDVQCGTDRLFLEQSWPKVERSKTTTAVFKSSTNPFAEESLSNGDSTRTYRRAAPSPPPRKKNSPLPLRESTNRTAGDLYFDNDHFLHVHSSSTDPPIAPMRRNSPKRQEKSTVENNPVTETKEMTLIEF